MGRDLDLAETDFVAWYENPLRYKPLKRKNCANMYDVSKIWRNA